MSDASTVRIRNLRKRMLRLPLGDMQRKTATVHVTRPPQGRGMPGAMTVVDGGRGRKRVTVDQQLVIPSLAVIDKLPDGNGIPSTITSTPSIAAALDRGDIRIED